MTTPPLNQAPGYRPTVQRGGTVSACELLNQPVEDMNGKPMGHLEDIIVEVDRGMIAYVIVGCEEGQRCALPYELIRIEREPLRLCVRVGQEIFRPGVQVHGEP